MILITGWSWYIWSHTVISFVQAGYSVVMIDNFMNSDSSNLEGIYNILWYKPIFYEGDMRNLNFLESVFTRHKFDAVIHLAWLKSVHESCINPIAYYDNNIIWSLNLFHIMEKFGVKNIIFSSSATVYDKIGAPCYKEDALINWTNPYGTTKIVIEKILQDLSIHAWWNVTALRYFNPIGSHKSWLIGENPKWVPNNLMPYIFSVARWHRQHIEIFGNNYSTIDWTWVRDYIDVNDLAYWHLAALRKNKTGFTALNLGSWFGISVIQMIKLVESVIDKKIPYVFSSNRKGDIGEFYADVSLANSYLWWRADIQIEESISNWWKYINQLDNTH